MMNKQLLTFFTIVALLVGVASVASINAMDRLSVDEAKTVIWKMNYKDTCALHKAVFPDEHKSKREATGCIDKIFQKYADCLDKAEAGISALYKAIREKIFGKTIVTRVLDTLKSATMVEQEVIKEAIQGSYKEYELSAAECFVGVIMAVIAFPIGIFVLCSMHRDHIKKIEAQRAGLPVPPDNMSLKTGAYVMTGISLVGLAGIIATCCELIE
jgi:hypothetical protein